MTAEKELYLGIDIGGTAAKMGILDSSGNILCRSSCDVSFDGYQTPILETCLDRSGRFLSGNHMDPSALSGVGISATGQIDTKTGVVIGSAGHIDNWIGSPLKESFRAKYGIPVSAANDANCAAVAEQWIGAAKGFANVIVITLGTGVGGGIIVHSALLEGGIGIAGELGHFSIDRNGIPCTCGNRGCYERYASTTALIRMARERYEEIPFGCTPEEIDGRRIFALLEAGDSTVREIVDQWISNIADGLVSLTHIFNPDIILLGGGVSSQRHLFIDRVKDEVLSRVMPQFAKNLRIEPAALTNDAGMIGAVRILMNSLKKTP